MTISRIINFINHQYLVLFIFFSFIHVCAETSVKPSIVEQANMIVKTAEKYHYSPNVLNDIFSETVYFSFLNCLDPHGLIFTNESLQKLDVFKYDLDDQIRHLKVSFLKAVEEVYTVQLLMSDSLLKGFRNKEIDLNAPDTLWLDYRTTYVKKTVIKKKWEQWIKYMMLWTLQSNADSTGSFSLPSLESRKEILAGVLKKENCKIQSKLNSPEEINEFIGSSYLKAISLAFDPHSEYLSFAEKNQWEASLSKESGSFGLRVNFNIVGDIEIIDVLPGGPAWNSNKINEGDVILDIRVSGGSTIDLRCATLSDIHDYLLSTDDNKASFKIRKKNRKIINVVLKKEVLEVEQNTIRSYVLKSDRSAGYVYIPSFYTNFTYNSYISNGCANDLAKELVKLKKASINGLILDLRGNGGGSLQEAFHMAGLFIDHGALGITHFRGKNPQTIKDDARGTMYNGPIVLLVNSSSASASELFAGVMKDYNRALIIGSNTFGKSTIQEMLPANAGDFDSLSHYKGDPPGFIILTTGSFYRVTGATIQKTGITPDIELPELFNFIQERESIFENALNFGNINKKVYYYPVNPLPADKIKELCDLRLKANSGFKHIRQSGDRLPKANFKYPFPLSFKLFKEYVNCLNILEDTTSSKKCPFTISLPDYDKNDVDTFFNQDNLSEEWNYSDIKSDLYINEAFNILCDLINITTKREK